MKQVLDICIDFDGTCTTHEFPHIGKDIGAQRVLKRLTDEGHRLILFTMRSDIDNPKSTCTKIINKGGKYLSDAIKWFEDNDIPLHGIQSNPDQKNWTHSPKAYGHIYIDDSALGTPLVNMPNFSGKPFVDWHIIEKMLVDRRVLEYEKIPYIDGFR